MKVIIVGVPAPSLVTAFMDSANTKVIIGGYAPGDYMCRCLICGKEFIGDKRAYECIECVAN